MSEFITFLRLGIGHIADPKAYDHILFVSALAVAYPLTAWRQLLVLITAFTLGHSLTLALATLNLVHMNPALVEVLIPVTIVISSVLAIVTASSSGGSLQLKVQSHRSRYLLTAIFGLIHGLGFSTFLRAILGGQDSIALPLFAFNAGLEVGQLAIVAAVLLLGMLADRMLRVAQRDWTLVLSGATAGVAVVMVLERLG